MRPVGNACGSWVHWMLAWHLWYAFAPASTDSPVPPASRPAICTTHANGPQGLRQVERNLISLPNVLYWICPYTHYRYTDDIPGFIRNGNKFVSFYRVWKSEAVKDAMEKDHKIAEEIGLCRRIEQLFKHSSALTYIHRGLSLLSVKLHVCCINSNPSVWIIMRFERLQISAALLTASKFERHLSNIFL